MPHLEEILGRVQHAKEMVLLLDYDGTLVPFAPRPELAAPNPNLLTILSWLVHREDVRVHIVSGRCRSSLETWLGAFPFAGLHAEHGLWSKRRGKPWSARFALGPAIGSPVLGVLEEAQRGLPRSLIEMKSASVAWHWRDADPIEARPKVNALTSTLRRLLGSEEGGALELLEGDHVLEVRVRGVHKGLIAREILTDESANSAAPLLIAIGDDVTDEDMFAALSSVDSAITIRVGDSKRPSCAAWQLRDPERVSELLARIVDLPGLHGSGPARPSNELRLADFS